MYASDRTLVGRAEIFRFHMLSAGNTGHGPPPGCVGIGDGNGMRVGPAAGGIVAVGNAGDRMTWATAVADGEGTGGGMRVGLDASGKVAVGKVVGNAGDRMTWATAVADADAEGGDEAEDEAPPKMPPWKRVLFPNTKYAITARAITPSAATSRGSHIERERWPAAAPVGRPSPTRAKALAAPAICGSVRERTCTLNG
jgi:hypothetical protein